MKSAWRAGSWPAAVAAFIAFALTMVSTPARSNLLEFTPLQLAGGHCGPSGTSIGPCPDEWNFGSGAFPVRWNINAHHGANIGGSRSLEDVIQNAFNAWIAAPNVELGNARVDEGSPSSLTAPNAADGINLIAFLCSPTVACDFMREPSTLAVTTTTTADAIGIAIPGHPGTVSQFVGQLLDADIMFNPATAFTTDAASASNQVQDLQTVATHEIGHFFGLDHSGVARAVMFPFAQSLQRTLSYDDVAGMSTLYPKPSPDIATGAITGSVTLNGAPVFGAHVFAESISTSQAFAGFPSVRKTPISTLTLPDGTFRITSLPPDAYTVTAEPLDGPVSNAQVSFYPEAFNQPGVQTGFTTRWH